MAAIQRKLGVRILNAATALALSALPGIVWAAELGDPQRGLVYAKKNCAECHAVERSQSVSPNVTTPSFSAVADMPGFNERALIVWFQSSDHATMPHLILAQEDLDNVAAYIMSLRAQK